MAVHVAFLESIPYFSGLSPAELVEGIGELQTKTAKIGIDATKPLTELDKFEKVDVPPEVRQKITGMLVGI